jgi:GxxExxY protein
LRGLGWGRKVNDHDRIVGITGEIIGAALTIHKELGPGLLESVYELILERELRERNLHVRRQVSVQFSYRGIEFKEAFRVDLLVEDCVVVELKAVLKLEKVFARQILTYMRILDAPAGLLINFGAPLLKDGLHRVINERPRSKLLCSNVRLSSVA